MTRPADASATSLDLIVAAELPLPFDGLPIGWQLVFTIALLVVAGMAPEPSVS